MLHIVITVNNVEVEVGDLSRHQVDTAILLCEELIEELKEEIGEIPPDDI